MKYVTVLSVGVLAVATLAAATLPKQDASPRQDANAAIPGKPHQDQAAMQEAYKKAAELSDEHREFTKCAGTWQTRVTCYMDPTRPQEGTGTATFETIMGGRFLVEHMSGNMPPMGPFQGMGILGFNNTTQQYEHVWLSDAGTEIMTARGTKGPDNSITLTGEMVDPVTNAKCNCTMVWRDVSENEKRFEMTCKQPAQESRMEAVYTRGAVGMR